MPASRRRQAERDDKSFRRAAVSHSSHTDIDSLRGRRRKGPYHWGSEEDTDRRAIEARTGLRLELGEPNMEARAENDRCEARQVFNMDERSASLFEPDALLTVQYFGNLRKDSFKT